MAELVGEKLETKILHELNVKQEVESKKTKGLPDKDKTCRICGIDSISLCSSCQNVYYCSKEHQKVDWKKHKLKCFPSKIIIEGNGSGRKLVVTKDLVKGDLILSEKPILASPNIRTSNGLTCLGCFGKIMEGQTISCHKCGWPVCNVKCGENACHVEECKIFQNCGIVPNETESAFQKYCKIAVIRTLLLKENNPSVFDDFPETVNLTDELFDVDDLVNFIMNDCKLAFSEDAIKFAYSVLRRNAFDTSDYSGFLHPVVSEIRYASLLFPTAILPGPNCIPNAHYTISGRINGSFSIKIYAAINIFKGEYVSVSLPYEDVMSPTFVRQEIKKKVFYQYCKCTLCEDPTELGTFLSGIRCVKCKKGFYTQISPLFPESEWKCNKCECQISHDKAKSVLQVSRSKLSESMNLGLIEDIVNEVKIISNTLLHPNNFLLLQAKMEICKRILAEMGNYHANNSNLHLKSVLIEILIEGIKHILSVADIIRPGYNRFRARLLYGLQYGLMFGILREKLPANSKVCPFASKGIKSHHKKKVEECKMIQDEAETILQLEPVDSLEERGMLHTIQYEFKAMLIKAL